MLRLLVFAYYFPPAGGAGVQRVTKWVKYLQEFGVHPTVVTLRSGAYPQLDHSLVQDVPSDVEVVRTAALDPFGLYARITGRSRVEAVAARTDDVGRGGSWPERIARWSRANLFVPDARIGWVPYAVGTGLRLIRRERPDAILTSGPPHSVHLTGRILQARTGVPWIADFRDPWTDIHYYDDLPRTDAARAVDARLERGVLQSAAMVATVSPSWADMLATRAQRSVEVIENGYDPADFTAPVPERDGRFTVVHVGSLYASRDPSALWQAVATLPADACARMVGRVGESVRTSAERWGVQVEWIPYLPHLDAVEEMRQATVLILSTEPHAQEAGHVTGKLYEYLASGRPVVGLGDTEGDAARLLTATGAGRMFEREDVDGFTAHMQGLYRRWRDGHPLAGADPEQAAAYSRRAQTGRLADLVRSLASSSSR
jgi:glycosyltransferase involved in cell wall biosynthesis